MSNIISTEKETTRTTIQIKKETKERLEKFGNLGSTFDSVLNEIIDHLESCDRWWVTRN